MEREYGQEHRESRYAISRIRRSLPILPGRHRFPVDRWYQLQTLFANSVDSEIQTATMGLVLKRWVGSESPFGRQLEKWRVFRVQCELVLPAVLKKEMLFTFAAVSPSSAESAPENYFILISFRFRIPAVRRC